MMRKNLFFILPIFFVCFFSLIAVKAQTISIFSLGNDEVVDENVSSSYAPGEIIIKYKEHEKELEEVLNDKKIRGGILIDGVEKEKANEKVSEGDRKDVFFNARKYKIPDLKNKAKEFFGNFSKARSRNKKLDKITVNTREFGNVVVDLKEKEIIDPYTKELLDMLNSDPDIEYAQINHSVETFAFAQSNPYYSLEWALENIGQGYPAPYGKTYIGKNDVDIDASEGWAIDKSNGGQGIVIGIIDTGIDYTHEEFGACTLEEVNDNYPHTCPKFTVGYDFYNKDDDPMDDNGHGTHCAGIIAALNNDKGAVGVAYNATLMPIKGLGKDGKSTDWDLANAVVWAADNGAKILNISWGVEADSSFLKDAFQYAYSKGVISVVAAGNGYGKDAMLFSPAKYDTVITVGATDSQDALAVFSNKGSKIDIVAPGTYILSMRANGTGDANYVYNEKYLIGSGTSMASPFIVGAAALVLANNPVLNQEDVRKKLR
ncbi:MAG: S8 family serine peptidase, partial [bacterium]